MNLSSEQNTCANQLLSQVAEYEQHPVSTKPSLLDTDDTSELPDYIRTGCENHVHDIYGFRNVTLTHVSRGRATITVPTTKGFGNVHGRMHGGALMALCDIVSGLTVYTLGKSNVTLSSSFNFMRGVAIDKAKTITCEGHVIHNGKKTCVVTVDVVDEQGILCVRGTFTQYVVCEVSPDNPIPVSTQGTNSNPIYDDKPSS